MAVVKTIFYCAAIVVCTLLALIDILVIIACAITAHECDESWENMKKTWDEESDDKK